MMMKGRLLIQWILDIGWEYCQLCLSWGSCQVRRCNLRVGSVVSSISFVNDTCWSTANKQSLSKVLIFSFYLKLMSELLCRTTKPVIGCRCKELTTQLNDREHLVMKLRSQMMEKDLTIQQLEQKLQRQAAIIQQQTEKIKQLEVTQIGNQQFHQYFEQEKFPSPYRERYSASPVYQKRSTSNLLSHREELATSTASTGFKKVSQHLTTKVSQKLVNESNDSFEEQPSVPRQSALPNYNQKLYEEFFILGASSTDVQKTVGQFIQTHGEHHTNLPSLKCRSSVLYRFSANQSIFQENKAVNPQIMVHQFIFPFGIELKKLSNGDGNSQVNEILFSNYTIDNNPNCFVVPINQNQDENIHISKKTDFESKNAVLNNINPEGTLNYVCVRFNDFIDINKHKRNERPQLWSHSKVICISTKFPFFMFFFKLLISFLNDVKLRRVQIYTEKSSFQEVDSDFWREYLEIKFADKIHQSLTSIALLNIPSFSQKLTVEFFGQYVILEVPPSELLDRTEIEWGIMYVIQNLSPQNIVQIFLSIMLEKSVVFISKHPHIMTCAVILFYKVLLRPMRWIHPVITSLPEDYSDLLDSPVPVIVGIMRGVHYLQQIQLPERHPDTLFVAIGENGTELINNNLEHPKSITKFLEDQLSTYYEILLQSPTNRFNPRNSEVHSKEACYKIVNVFQSFLKQKVIANFPKNAHFKNQSLGILDFDALHKQTSRSLNQQFLGSTEFWKQVFKTQLIIYLMEAHYDRR